MKKIDHNFLQEICEKFNIEYTKENLTNIINQCDIDKDGFVNEDDLLHVFKKTNLL